MSIKERLFGQSYFKLQEGEKIILKNSAPFSFPHLNLFRLFLFILPVALFVFVGNISLFFATTLLLLMYIGIVFLKNFPLKNSSYILTDRRIYVFERYSLNSVAEGYYNLDDIHSYSFEYESRLLNTGYIYISDFRGQDSKQINYHPMTNVHGYYNALGESSSSKTVYNSEEV